MAKEMRKFGPISSNATNGVLDDTNLEILAHLQENPRLTMSELGRRIGMSSPAVTERVRRMEEAGVIVGYQLALDPMAIGLPIAAYIRVRPSPGQLPRVAELAAQIPAVVECQRVTGEDCFVMKLYVPTMDRLEKIIDRFLLYGTTTTSIVQSSPVPLRPPPLPNRRAIASYPLRILSR